MPKHFILFLSEPFEKQKTFKNPFWTILLSILNLNVTKIIRLF